MLAQKIKRWLELSLKDGVPGRSAKVALVVGPILTAINQGDHFLQGDGLNWWKVALTFLVPYVVATVGAVGAKSAADQAGERTGN